MELDAGMGVPFRPGTFDGCIRYFYFARYFAIFRIFISDSYYKEKRKTQ